ncbi:unnamed protein product [Allacma fusca]|uniref:Uncharacterized protein n=1 Tax=Allacma fusca TaxID=39272 RepID=A0A8J2LKD7_9HEXA|nr:unnamed protein product [Allacma fusca]
MKVALILLFSFVVMVCSQESLVAPESDGFDAGAVAHELANVLSDNSETTASSPSNKQKGDKTDSKGKKPPVKKPGKNGPKPDKSTSSKEKTTASGN